jgi:hypothetical protein
VCLELREKANEHPTFICRIITGDESWIYGYDPETKQQSPQWKSRQSPRTKKALQVLSSKKSMLIVYLDVKGIVHREFVPPDTHTVFQNDGPDLKSTRRASREFAIPHTTVWLVLRRR